MKGVLGNILYDLDLIYQFQIMYFHVYVYHPKPLDVATSSFAYA